MACSKGGKVEGEGGSILDIPEGALSGPTIVKLTFVPEAGLASPVPAPGKYLSAFNIDTGGIDFLKEVHLSMPLPEGFDIRTPVFVNRPSEIYNADGTIETVYEIIDSTKVINNRLTTASPPFSGITQIGSFAFISFGGIQKGIVSGYTYQEMNDQTGYQPPPKGVIDPTIDASGNLVYKYDRPIKGAVIRTPDAWNYVSYSNDSGFYAGFATLYAYVEAMELDYKITAIHPLTMRRTSLTLFMDVDHNLITNLNFMLADKNSIPPDKTAPVIDLTMQVSPGQAPANRISSGTMPLGTELQFPLSISDQSSVNPTLTVEYKSPEATTWQQYSAPLIRMGAVLSSAPTADKPAIWRYTFKAVFPAELQGSQDSNCKPGLAGNYRFTVEATDTSSNKSTKTLQLRVVPVVAIPGGVDGAPTVDSIAPADGTKDLPVTTQITVWFSEPVENVTSATLKLIDTSNGQSMPTIITTSYEGGRMQAVLTPRGNLSYDRQYQVQVSGGITDINPNPSADNAFLPLPQEYRSTFTTKRPSAYDLAEADQFKGGRGIALYNHYDGNSYAYIAADDKGWHVADVSDPASPTVVYSQNMSTPAVSWSYRGVAVHPEPSAGIMAMTENIAFGDGNQYGYVRIYDIKTDPVKPEIIGKQRLAEAYSGIPGQIALDGDYAYIATASAALQVVSISKSKDNFSGFSYEDNSIVGVFDSIGLGYGSPNDIEVYGKGKALLTTTSGYLITLDINNPTPVQMGVIEPRNLNALRVAGVSGFGYADGDGNPQVMDLALTGGGGRLKTVDLTDPYNPKALATVKDAQDKEVVSYPYDITLNKETGLAVVSTLSAIQVVDVKDPKNPRLINTITQLPDGNGAVTPGVSPVQLPIGVIPAMVEQDGWVYMVNDKQGLKVVQFITRTIDILRINPIEIDDTGHSINDAVITYRVNNKDYEIHSGEVNIYKNGVRILTLPSGTGHTASVTIPKGQAFDVNSKYEAVVVINKMSADVLTSYKARISVFNVKAVIENPNNLFIDNYGKTMNALKVKYTILPANYQAKSAKVVLVDGDGNIKQEVVGHSTGTGTVVFAKGVLLGMAGAYKVYVVLNSGLLDVKESEKKPVKVGDVSGIELRDNLNPCNRLPDKFNDKRTIIVLAADTSQISKFNFWYDQSLLDHEYGQFIWQLYRKSDNSLVKTGVLGSEPIEVNEAGYFIVKLFLDENGNGVVDANELQVREHTINSIKYDYNADVKSLKDGSFLSGMALTQLTQSFLELFINDNPATSMDIPAPSPQGKVLDTGDPKIIKKLTHFVGADFDIANECKATMSMYDYPTTSIPSQKIAESSQFKSVIRQVILNKKAEISSRYIELGMPATYTPYKHDREEELDFKYTVSPDLWFGIGDSSVREINMNLTIDYNGGAPIVKSARITATVDDLYDFAIGTMFPADIAARVQFGYGRNGEVGKSGKIYWNTFNVDTVLDFTPLAISLDWL